jgi:hypothetical protein
LALSRTRQEEQELHDDTKGQEDDNDFYGKRFFGVALASESKMEPD